jgi:hypothetical protein
MSKRLFRGLYKLVVLILFSGCFGFAYAEDVKEITVLYTGDTLAQLKSARY